jgi:putative PIN family toxin of toxin-antitoxin system
VKVVLDTNVFVSGIFFNGPPYQILQAWQEQRIELVVSPDILTEYKRVGDIMAEEHPAINLKPILEYVIHNATVYDALPLSFRVCEDPDDDKFLACALAGGASVIVSGDKHLLKVSGYQGIEVLKPRDFVSKYLLDI